MITKTSLVSDCRPDMDYRFIVDDASYLDLLDNIILKINDFLSEIFYPQDIISFTAQKHILDEHFVICFYTDMSLCIDILEEETLVYKNHGVGIFSDGYRILIFLDVIRRTCAKEKDNILEDDEISDYVAFKIAALLLDTMLVQ